MDKSHSFRIAELIKLREKEIGKKLSFHRIGREIGLHHDTVRRYAENEVTIYEARILDAFCTYFDCDIRELFDSEDALAVA